MTNVITQEDEVCFQSLSPKTTFSAHPRKHVCRDPAEALGEAVRLLPKGDAWRAIIRGGPPAKPVEGGKYPRGYRKAFWNRAWAAYRVAREGVSA